MFEREPKKQSPFRGRLYRRAANFICRGRIAAAPVIFGYTVLNPEYPSWKFGVGMLILEGSDGLDGFLARKGAKHLGSPPTPEGAKLDQVSDKFLFHGTLGGLAVREALNGNPFLAPVYGINQAIAGYRDWKVNRLRNQASEQGIDVKARRGGKIKTLVYGAATAAACSPIVEMTTGHNLPVGELMVGGSLTAGTALAVWSGIDNIRNMRAQMQPVEPTEPVPILLNPASETV